MLASHVWRHRKAIVALVAMLCLVGAYFAVHLPVAIFPQLVIPRILVAADAGDIPIQSTLVQVTRPVEAAVSTVPGVTRVQSTTTRGSASLEITFDWGTDMQLALQRVQGQAAEVRPTLPANTNLTVAVVNPSIFPIMGYSLTSETQDLTALRHVALYTLRPRLARLPGVAQVRVTGGKIPEFRVAVRPAALAARGLTLQDVQDALSKANSVSAVGTFDREYQRFDILVSGLLRDAADIEAVTVATHNGVPITVADVATVSRAVRPPTILATGSGKPAVLVNIIKQPSANTVQVADEVRQAFAGLQGTLPAGVQTTVFYDQSEIVRQSEASVVESIVVGGVLALIVLMLFLGNARASACVLILLPLTLLGTFALMKAMGQTLNIMTLGAMAVALGLVIDDGIVVVENIVHERERGESGHAAVAYGLQGITPAMIGSSITTMAAFFPLTLLTGVTGQFFAPLALVMVATLGLSLVLSLTITPLLARALLGSGPPRPHRPGVVARVTDLYGRLLGWSLRRPAGVFLALLPLVAAPVWLYHANLIKTGFFPEFDEGAFVIDYLMPAGTSLSETDRVCRQVEDMLSHTPEVASWSRLTGTRSGSGLELTEPNQGDILVRLKDARGRTADAVMDDLRTQIEGRLPQFQIDMVQMLQDGIGDIAGGSPKPVEVKLFGLDAARLVDLAHHAGEIISKTPGVVDEYDGVVMTGPQLQVRLDPLKAGRFGLTTDSITNAVAAAWKGTVATTVQQGEEGIDVRVQADRTQGISSMAAIPLPNPSGTSNGSLTLSAVASLDVLPGAPQVTRENQQPMVAVTARLKPDVDLGTGIRDVQHRLAAGLPLPFGYRMEYGGLYAGQQQSFLELAGVLLLTVVLASTLLLVQFRSVRQSLALLAAAALSLSGVVLGLFVTGTPLNISSFTGAVMIVGVVTENGIVLFDFFNHLHHQQPDRPFEELMAEAGRQRLRPILMTTIGAILALLPLALGIGAGAAMQKPLAIAVIGGLTVSTAFTLLVAPTLFCVLAGRRVGSID